MRPLRIIWGATVCLLALLLLCAGGLELWGWQQFRTGQYFGIKWDWIDHFWLGVRYLVHGGAGYAGYAYGTFRRPASLTWRFAGIALITLGVLHFLTIQMVTPAVLLGAYADARVTIQIVGHHLIAWQKDHGRYPASAEELRAAVAQLELESPLVKGGQTIPYRLVYVGGARGPAFPQLSPAELAVLYCAISPDMQTFWLTITVPKELVGRSVTWLRGRDGSRVFTKDSLPFPASPPSAN